MPYGRLPRDIERAINRLITCAQEDALSGGGDPEEVPRKKSRLKRAKANLAGLVAIEIQSLKLDRGE